MMEDPNDPLKMDDAHRWEAFRKMGMSVAEATASVERTKRAVTNAATPAKEAPSYGVRELARDAGGALSKFGDGIPFANDALALNTKAVGKLFGYKVPSSDSLRAAIAAPGKQFGEEHPKTGMALEMAGGVAPYMLAGPAAGGASALRASIGKKLGQGAMIGAIAGAGNSLGGDDIGQRAGNTLMGAGAGIAGSAGAQVAGAVGGKVVDAIGRSKVGEWVGAKVPGILTAADQAKRALIEKLQAGGLSVGDVQRTAALPEHMGQPTSIMELGGDEVRRLARGVQAKPNTSSIIRDPLQARQQGQYQRFADAGQEHLGIAPENVSQTAADKLAEAQTASAPHFQQMEAHGAVDDPTLNKFLGRPLFKSAYRDAKDMGLVREPQIKPATVTEQVTTSRPLDMETIQPARTGSGRVRSNPAVISDDHLEAEINRLAEKQAEDGAYIASVTERPHYEEGRDLRSSGYHEDAAGMMDDPAEHQKVQMVKAQYDQRAKSLATLQAESARREQAMLDAERGGDVGGDASFHVTPSGQVMVQSTTEQTKELPTAWHIHRTKLGMDNHLSGEKPIQGTGGTASSEAHDITSGLSAFRDRAREVIPGFAAADDAYAGPAGQRASLQQGSTAFNGKVDADALRAQIAATADKGYYQRGAFNDLLHQARSMADYAENRPPDRSRVFTGSMEKRNAIGSVFGDKPGLPNFQNAANREANYSDTYHRVLGGPETGRIVQDAAGVDAQNGLSADVALRAVNSPISSAFKLLSSLVGKGQQEYAAQVAEQLAPMMVAGVKNPAELQGLLTQLAEFSPRLAQRSATGTALRRAIASQAGSAPARVAGEP